MTHSDQYKPLGMNGLGAISYENSGSLTNRLLFKRFILITSLFCCVDTTMSLVTHQNTADTGSGK